MGLALLQAIEMQPACLTIIPKAMQLVSELGLYACFSTWASEDGYKGPSDWLVAKIYPEEIPAIKAYYAGTGKLLKDIHSSAKVKRMDAMLCRCLQEAVEIVKTGEIPPWAEE